jgi:hypothetical protein
VPPVSIVAHAANFVMKFTQIAMNARTLPAINAKMDFIFSQGLQIV